MNTAFIVHIDLASVTPEELILTSEELFDVLTEAGYIVNSVNAWDRPSVAPAAPPTLDSVASAFAPIPPPVG